MAPRVIILCGSCNSGKSRTLRRLRDHFLRSRDGVPRFRRRPVHIEISSLQEQCNTCDEEGRECVVKTIEEWVDAATEDNASLLVIPFTMKYSRGSEELNEVCIRRPLNLLKRWNVRFNIVYLRREHKGPERNDDMDNLMRNLFDRITESRRDGEVMQARKLFQFIRSVA